MGLIGCAVDLDRSLVHRTDGSKTKLTTRECEVLRYLVARPGAVVERDELLQAIWGASPLSLTRACDSAIRRLRQKVERLPDQPEHLLTVHGAGYQFVPLAPVRTPAPAAEERVLHLGDRVVDLGRQRVVQADGRTESLTQREVALVERLAAARGACVDRSTLAHQVCGQRVGRALDTLVYRVRAKLEPDPSNPVFLLRSHRGYRLDVPAVTGGSPSQLFGRDSELAQVMSALEEHSKVLLLGAGGIGKTAIARMVAARTGAVWVDAGRAGSTSDLARIIERALGAAPADALQLEDVAELLVHASPRLVVLDEVEGIRDVVGSALGAWRRAAPNVRFLLTSRVRMEVDATVEIGPLRLSPAVELFVSRARRQGWSETSASPSAVRRLVEGLDGVPLAIELSASRLNVLSVDGQLSQPLLELLSDPHVAGRHGSLRAALLESWRTLDPPLQDALLLLSHFATFTVADALLVCPAGVEVISELRSRSWLAALGTEDGQLVLGMLHTVRAFVEEQRTLDPNDRQRRMRFVRGLAQFGATLVLDQIAEWLPPIEFAQLRHLAPELVRATQLAVELGELHLAARCAEAASLAAHREGRWKDALDAVEVRARLGPGLDRARLELAAGRAYTGLFGTAEVLELMGSVAEWSSEQDPILEAEARILWAELAQDPAQAERAKRAAERAEHPFLAEWAQAMAHKVTGQRDARYHSMERALALANRSGSIWQAHRTLSALAFLDAERGALALAASRFDTLARLMGDERPGVVSLRPRVLAFQCRASLDDSDLVGVGEALLEECTKVALSELAFRTTLGLAKVWLARGRPDRTSALCRSALADPRMTVRPPHTYCELWLRYWQMRAELDLGRPNDAIATAMGAAPWPTDEPLPHGGPAIEAVRGLAEAFLGQPEAGLARLQAVMPALDILVGDRISTRILRARIYLSAGDLAAAIRDRDEAVQIAVTSGMFGVFMVRQDLAGLERELPRPNRRARSVPPGPAGIVSGSPG